MRDIAEEKLGEKGGDPLSVLTLCQSNTKVTPGGGDGAKGRLGQRGDKAERERLGDSFLCLPHCLPAQSLPLSSYLAVLPLTSSQRPLSFFLSFVAWPLLIPHSLPFVWQASTREIITPPSSLRLIPFLGYLLHLQTYLHLFPSSSPASHASSLLLSMWLLWKQVYLEIAGGKLVQRFCPFVHVGAPRL